VSDSGSDESSPEPPESERATLDRISAQLKVLIPEVRKLRRARWLTWGVAVALIAAVAVGIGGWVTYQQDRDDDQKIRAEQRAVLEQALVAECESSADQTADLRTAMNVLIGVAVDPNDPQDAAAAQLLNDRLDEAIPPRDCIEEARVRLEGG
jgi:hypothetical protein